MNRKEKSDGLRVKPHFAKQNVLTVNRKEKSDGLNGKDTSLLCRITKKIKLEQHYGFKKEV